MEHYKTVYEELVEQLGASEAQTHLSKSLFAIVIGSNDLFGYFEDSTLQKKSTPQQHVDLMVLTLKQQLQVLTAGELINHFDYSECQPRLTQHALIN